MGRWNEREHPRHLRGSGRNSGRFRDKTGSDWAQRISEQIGLEIGGAVAELGRDRGDGTRTVTAQQLAAASDLIQPGMLEFEASPGQWVPVHEVLPWGKGGAKVMFSAHNGREVWTMARVKPAGTPVRPFDSPAPRIGKPRGDGTYEVTGAELYARAGELEGRINYHPHSDDGARLLDPRPVMFIDGNDRTVDIREAINVGSLLRHDSRVVISYLDEPTQEQQFFEMRVESGLESEETLGDLLSHPDRYEGKFEIYNPTTDTWDLLQSVEYDEDEWTGEDIIKVWFGEAGDEGSYELPDDPAMTVKIRPTGRRAP